MYSANLTNAVTDAIDKTIALNEDMAVIRGNNGDDSYLVVTYKYAARNNIPIIRSCILRRRVVVDKHGEVIQHFGK